MGARVRENLRGAEFVATGMHFALHFASPPVRSQAQPPELIGSCDRLTESEVKEV
jgi:hypothetical protein